MSIYKYYKVKVNIPDRVADKYYGTLSYDQKIGEAIRGYNEAGSNSYSEVEEWATFDTLEEAQQCERNLMNVIYYFNAKMLDE